MKLNLLFIDLNIDVSGLSTGTRGAMMLAGTALVVASAALGLWLVTASYNGLTPSDWPRMNMLEALGLLVVLMAVKRTES